MDSRLPAHVEVAGFIRAVEAAGGFATVLAKGERDAGTIVLILTENGTNARVFERMPMADGSRKWTCSKLENTENKKEFSDYLDRRRSQDRDMWLIELDVADAERFVGIGPQAG